jgi:hypothetical protein
MRYLFGVCERFAFSWDMNGDGAVTISDVFQWFDFALHLPAKIGIGFIDKMPSVARFFEVGSCTGEGWGGAVFSLIVWFYMGEKLLKRV